MPTEARTGGSQLSEVVQAVMSHHVGSGTQTLSPIRAGSAQLMNHLSSPTFNLFYNSHSKLGKMTSSYGSCVVLDSSPINLSFIDFFVSHLANVF